MSSPSTARRKLTARPRAGETSLSLLLIEDNPGDARLVRELLAELHGQCWPLVWADSLASGLVQLSSRRFDVLLVDLNLPDSYGLDTVRSLQAATSGAPIVVFTGLADSDLALSAVQEGAQDYLVKGNITPDVLNRVLEYAVERYRYERGQHFLVEASRVLASSLDYETTLQGVAQLAVPEIADLCLVDVVESERTVHRVAVAPAEPFAGINASELCGHFELPCAAAYGVPRVLSTGQPELVARVQGSLKDLFPLLPSAGEPNPLELLARLRPCSRVIVPLVARGRTLGCVTLVWTEGSARTYSEPDVRLAEQLAERAALAIDNARLFGEATTAIAMRDQALRTRDEVLRFVSHDLKNPLTTMFMQSELMLSVQQDALTGDTSDCSTAQLDRGLRRIRELTLRMSDMVGELVDATRLQAGHLVELKREPTDLVGLAQRAVAEHQMHRDGHIINLRAAVPSLVGQWDPARLKRVVENLLGNATKYSPEGGTVTVSLARERREGRNWAVMRVEDSGIGIPQGDLPRMFELFFRASNVPRQVGGTGIGLAGVQQVVHAHGGSVTVESCVGRGSVFSVFLPV